MNNDIYKAAGIIIRNRKLLVSRSKGKDIFVAPGGKLESGETAKQALLRELKEELAIDVEEEDLAKFGSFKAPAAGQEDRLLHMEVFVVRKFQGKLIASREVEEIAWVTSRNEANLVLGSIFEHEVMPRLKGEGLIA